MSRNWNDEDFGRMEDHRPTPNGRKKDRREKRHDAKHHLRDLKDMVNGGEDIYDMIDEISEEE